AQRERRSWEAGRAPAIADVERRYINGEWVHAEGGAAFDVMNPADRSVIARVTNGAVPDVERAVAAAHAAFREWSVQAPKDRGRFLLRIQELMEVRRDDLARLVTLENGKPFEEAKKEVQFSLGYFGWFAEEARRVQRADDQPVEPGWRASAHAPAHPQDRLHGLDGRGQGDHGDGGPADQAAVVRARGQRAIHRVRGRGSPGGGRGCRRDEVPA